MKQNMKRGGYWGVLALAFGLMILPVRAANFTLTVNNGSGSGVYAAGSEVHIWANPSSITNPAATTTEPSDPASPDRVFDRWGGATGPLADAIAAHTRLVMPASNLTVTAQYRDGRRWMAPRIIAEIPPGHHGVIFMFHGRGGSAEATFSQTERRRFIADALVRGFGVVALDSFDRVERIWQDATTATANSDMRRMAQARNQLIADGRMSASDPLHLVGISNGGEFASLLAAQAGALGLPVSTLALVCSPGADSASDVLTIPTIYLLAANDSSIDNDRAQLRHANMVNRGVTAALFVNPASAVYPRRFWRIEGLSAADSEGIQAALKTAGLLNTSNMLQAAAFGDANHNGAEDWFDVLPPAYMFLAGEIEGQLEVCFAEHEFYSDLDSRLLDFFATPYTAVDELPTIDSFTPSVGAPGITVTLLGSQFVGVQAVRFNGVTAAFTVQSSTRVQATVPANATTGPIELVAFAGSALSPSVFTVQRFPVITSVSPAEVSVGQQVTIIGQNLSQATKVQFVDKKNAFFVVDSDTKIRATVPAGAVTGKVRVTTFSGTAVSPERVRIR